MEQQNLIAVGKKSWHSKKRLFTFIDLFAGIGGFRIAAEMNDGVCVFSSEWDKNSQKTYMHNHGETPAGDITKISETSVPDHDILFGGFPCQAFSISGKMNGFDDTRGTLFFDIARIIKSKRPKALLLENVKNFTRHDGGNTLKVVLDTLDDLGYEVQYRVLRSSDYGVPQARERVYIVGFRKDLNLAKDFQYPEPNNDGGIKVVRDIIEGIRPSGSKPIVRDLVTVGKTSDNIKKPLKLAYFNKGGQGERVYSIDHAGITLSAYGGGVASKTGAYLMDDGSVRKLTPRECARMQGFPDDFSIVVTANLALKQFGDSVSVPVLQRIIDNMIESMGIENVG